MKEIDIQLISKYRSHLMGIAIILIMITHNTFTYQNTINDCIREFADGGVDVFFLLSGFGCYFAVHNYSTLEFIKRRMVRILPSYLLIVIPYSLFLIFSGSELESVLINFSLISFWVNGNLTEWFIAAILLLYILTPWLVRFVEKKYLSIFCIGFYFLLVLCRVFQNQELNLINEIFSIRIPIYIFGMFLAKVSSDHSLIIRKSLVDIGLVVTLLGWISLHFFHCDTMLRRGITGWMYVFICFELVYLFDKRNVNLSILHILGGITLEIYLLHQKMEGICYHLFQFLKEESKILFCSNIFAIILAVGMAYI